MKILRGNIRRVLLMVSQIGFLTEWQMYAQKIEGDSWRGEKIDKGKIDKMSGSLLLDLVVFKRY